MPINDFLNRLSLSFFGNLVSDIKVKLEIRKNIEPFKKREMPMRTRIQPKSA